MDGSPVGLGHKYSYPPNMEAVQETTIVQNGSDAQYGHSAGGVINVATKSGTDQWHGTAYYGGRYPWLNAISDRTTNPPSINSTRQNMLGGAVGGPVIKNKLFNFANFEYWKVAQPSDYVVTVPTAAQAEGNFSQTYNINGQIAPIYDPFSTVYNPVTNTYTRAQYGTPADAAFGGSGTPNVIAPGQMDPTGKLLMGEFWAPNSNGVNITNANNYNYGYNSTYNYYNWSDRVDYQLNDKWRIFGRISGYHTEDVVPNFTPNKSPLYVPAGTFRTAKQEMASAIWTVNPTTVVTFHGDYHSVVDAYISPTLAPDGSPTGFSSIWPNNNWYGSYLQSEPNTPVYEPYMVMGGNGFGGSSLYWNQRPKAEDFSADYSHTKGSHYIRAGVEFRRSGGWEFIQDEPVFNFETYMTSNSPVSGNTLISGNPYATLLSGALDNNSEMIGGPAPVDYDKWWGMFIQDDWKVTHKLTVNLGLRNEYETAWYGNNMSRGLNLNSPVLQMVANPVKLGTAATSTGLNPLAIEPAGYYSGLNYGQWQWDAPGQGMWNPPALALAPRAGLAYRLNDKTSLRLGYARFVIPTEYNFTAAPFNGFEDVNFVEPPFFGETAYQYTAPLANGVPQQRLSNPFPANVNPLATITGPAAGTNVGRGGESLLWFPDNFNKAYNDRLIFDLQHQFAGGIVGSATWFTNFGHQHYTKELNAINPLLEIQYQNTLSQAVPNPYYGYLNSSLMPGPLHGEPTVPLSSLLVPYPQYGPLYQIGTCCAGERYNEVQLQARKPFSHGATFMVGYVHILEYYQINNFNDLTYVTNQFQWQNSDQPRNHLNIAASYLLPFGRGRTFLPSANRVVDALVGGWRVSPVFTYLSGDSPRFGAGPGAPMLVVGNPCVSSPTPGHWFNQAAFQPVPSNQYTLRDAPWQFACIRGPSFWDVDASLAKDFQVTEKIHAQISMKAYNAFNNLNRGDPDTNVTDSTFGDALYQGSPGGTFGAQSAYEYVSGRQVELDAKITF